MNNPSVIPPPILLVNLLDAEDADARRSARIFLVNLLTSPDPLTRWGTVNLLLHIPLRLYQAQLLDELQDDGQPEEIRFAARLLWQKDLGKPPAAPAHMLRIFAHLRGLLYLVANLHRYWPGV